MITAFDADVLIYAASDHPLADRIVAAIDVGGSHGSIGSVMLLPELLAKPIRDDAAEEQVALVELLARLDLHPVDESTAALATSLAATYRLKAIDAVHLATALTNGADRFVTNNRRDFGRAIAEIDIVYPEHLPDA